MKKKETAIVTGGAGFIGSHMVDLLLDKGFSVKVIDNYCSGNSSNLKHHEANQDLSIDERDILSITPTDKLFKDVSYVFHFAGIGDIVPSIERPAEYMSVNLQGTVKVLEAARMNAVKKLIYAASSSCYGIASTPTNEHAPINLQYPYACSKFMGEQACFHWHHVYNLPFNSIRIFNAYGTRSRTSGAYGAVMGVFLKQKLENKQLTVVGDGSQKRDFVYATDVTEAFYRAAMTKKSGEIYNVGAGNPQAISYLVQLLGGDIEYIPKRPGEPDCTWADITKITNDLAWQPKVSFELGVSYIVKDIEYWRTAPLWNPTSIQQSTKTWFEYLSK